MEHRSTLGWLILTLIFAAGAYALIAGAQESRPRTADAAITRSVEQAMLKVRSFKALDIRVDTRDGVVRLHGFVNTVDEIAHAADVARGVDGVSAVRNDLRVANKASRA